MNSEFCLEDSMGFLVGRASRVLALKLNKNFATAGFDVTLDHWIILNKLLYYGEQKQQTFSEITGWDKTTLTRIIDFMEDRKWVYRAPHKQDRRVKLIHLTTLGKGLHADLRPIVQQTNEEVESQLDPQDLAKCKKVLKEVFDLVHTHD